MSGTRRTHSRAGLHFFVLHAHARHGRDGAYIRCWIDFRLHEGALALAKHYVRRSGWVVRSVQEQRWIDGAAQVSRDARTYFREAKEDGASFVFHRYVRRTPRSSARRSS